MSGPPPGPPIPPELAGHQAELLRLATFLVPPWLAPLLGPDDLVQQTLLEGWKDRDRLARLDGAGVTAYLRQVLRNNAVDAIRKHAPARGDVSPDVLAYSSVRLAERLAAEQTSPSGRAERAESFARLAAALTGLPDAQRVAVEMRYLRGLRVAEIAHLLDRSVGAVSLLLHRALASLRYTLSEPNSTPGDAR